MSTSTKRFAWVGVIFSTLFALTGCGHQSDAAQKTPAQIQQEAQQQAAQRAAYFNSHSAGAGQNPAAAPAYRGHP